LKINHGIHHFKLSKPETDLLESLGNKANIICSSPFEYEFYTKKLKYILKKFIIQVLLDMEDFNIYKKITIIKNVY